MPKKYIQLLLSINFCLTAIAAIANSDTERNTSSMLPADISMNDMKNEFDQIWECLEEVEIIYESESLEEFIEEHRNIETPYDESSAEISSQKLSEDYDEFRDSFLVFLDLPNQGLDQFSKNKLSAQQEKFLSCLGKIDESYSFINQHNLKKEKFFFANQCRKFQDISFNEILENSMLEEDFTFQNTAPDNNEKNGTTSNEPFIRKQFKGQFKRIWRGLERVRKNYPSSAILQISILKHKQSENATEGNEEDLAKDLVESFSFLRKKMPLLPKCQLAESESLNRGKKNLVKRHFNKIIGRMQIIESLYTENSETLSKNTQVFLRDQLAELVFFSKNFLKEDSKSNNTPISELNNEDPLHSKFSPMQTLDDQFNQIWAGLDKINAIHRSKLLQELISHYKGVEIPYNESLKETSKEALENLFTQLHKDFEVCSQYQLEEELDENNQAELNTQFNQIKNRLNFIHEIYNSKKESLSKNEKVFLKDHLAGLQKFSSSFITENSLQEKNATKSGLSSLKKVQRSLDSCQEEDSLIYLQSEYIMNSQEADISDLLTSSRAENNIMNHFLYFNEAEGLIEIQHEELRDEMLRDEEYAGTYTEGVVGIKDEMLGDDEYKYSESYDKRHHKPYIKPYTTIWKIRPADVKTVKNWNWQEQDSIIIDKTGLLSKFTMRAEVLDYTLTHSHSHESVRANFVCKSSKKNTYTILSIDYLENIVVLKNGPCLLMQHGDLKEWHVEDTVVLQRVGSSMDTKSPHELVNKTRNRTILVSLIK